MSSVLLTLTPELSDLTGAPPLPSVRPVDSQATAVDKTASLG
ncbi:hypothetical protein [Myxococcus sp. AB036A]|nr:hypothetical protein [Myxococcus sp. AB036A]